MNIEIKRFRTDNYELAKKAFKIRTLVFVREQNVDPKIEYDEFENQCEHYLLYVDGEPVGAARWRINDKGVKLERFSILPEYRNKKLGDQLVKHVLKDVLPLRKPIYLHSQARSVGVYERNHFTTKGEMFVEADIDHYLMEYEGPENL